MRVLLLLPLLVMTHISPSSSSAETGRLFNIGDNDDIGLNGVYQVWEDIYDLIIRDYVSDVYVDVMETFIGASIKLLGWAAFGTFLILKGAWLNSQSDSADTSSSYHAPSAYLKPGYHHNGRTFASSSLIEDFGGKNNESEPLNYTLPYLDKYLGLDLTFPVDNSLQGCYNRRASCVNNDWGAEVGHLLGRATETGTLMSRWLQFGEKLMSLSSLDGDNVDVVDVDPEFPEYF